MGERVESGGNRIKNTGLRGLSVADTRVSFINGHKGILIYRGYRIEELARKSGFIETVYLLLNGKLPTFDQLQEFHQLAASSRELPDNIIRNLKTWPRHSASMDVIQGVVPMLGAADSELYDTSRDANVRKSVRLIARMPAVAAAWHRIRHDLPLIPPDNSLGHAANFLYQLTGSRPTEEFARALDVCMLIQAEHTFNASTFACRQVASTRAHLYACVAAGVGALSGALHGGANMKVMQLILGKAAEWNSREAVTLWVREQLDNRRKIMGMGHAVYKTYDPRVEIMKEWLAALAPSSDLSSVYEKLKILEEACIAEFERRGKAGIKANVDFYSGLLLAIMGVPLELMTPVFAFSLLAGWCAHIIEETFSEAQDKPALYRPEADYIGRYCGESGCVYPGIKDRR